MADALTAAAVAAFEADQQAHGTKVALFNWLWLKAHADLRAIGVKRTTTRLTVEPTPTARRVGPAYKRGRA